MGVSLTSVKTLLLHTLIPAPLVTSYCLQKGSHVKATHPVLYTWVFLSAEHAEICNALLFPDLWMELKEGENITPAVLLWGPCSSCAGEYKQKWLTGLCLGFICRVLSFFNCFVDFIFHLSFLSQFSPYGKAWFFMFYLKCAKQLEVGGKKRGIENYATGFSGGPEQTGSRVWETGTDGSFEFGLNSGKAVPSISDRFFCMCAWQIVKWLFWD